jgi:hypothetical protein
MLPQIIWLFSLPVVIFVTHRVVLFALRKFESGKKVTGNYKRENHELIN